MMAAQVALRRQQAQEEAEVVGMLLEGGKRQVPGEEHLEEEDTGEAKSLANISSKFYQKINKPCRVVSLFDEYFFSKLISSTQVN